MHEDRPSPSALTAAAMRAAHLGDDLPHVLEDPYAIELTSPEYRELHRAGGLAASFRAPGIRSVQGHVLGRARYAEDQLAAAVDAGVTQLVIVAAGLDTVVLRHPQLVDRLRVFELDHVATQSYKLARLAELGLRIPDRVRFLALDLLHERIDQVLARHGFDAAEPAFFSVLGVLAYLARPRIREVLASIRSCSVDGSQIVFDYPVSPELLTSQERWLADQVSQETRRGGEPRPVKHVPQQLQALLRRLGFALVDELSPAALERRYFAGRSDGLRPYCEMYISHWSAANRE